ncbi:MAG: glycosyltransferase family 4 protein [Verrucomicrobiota bacterium]
MKLLFVHECFSSLGGAEANAFITATEMQKRGHEVALLTQKGTGKNEPAWRELFSAGFFQLDRIEDALETYRPDVIYIHKWEHLPSLHRLLATDRPLVRMVHDHDTYCLRSYKYNVFTRNICHRPATPYCIFPCLAPLKRNREGGLPFRWASYFDKIEELALNRRFDRHLVVTHYMKNELVINGLAPERIEIFPPVPRPGDALRSSFSDRNLLLYAGQIIRGKGVDVLLHALAKVRNPFEMVILGDGNHRAACEKLSKKLGLSGRVTFKGFIPQVELKGYYRDTSAVLISSVWPEPIATIGLEVMRYALPVIAFDAGGIKDWLHDGINGYLIPWMDTDAFAARIDELLEDKAKAKQMGERGLEIVSRDYDFDEYLARLENLFARVASEPIHRTP